MQKYSDAYRQNSKRSMFQTSSEANSFDIYNWEQSKEKSTVMKGPKIQMKLDSYTDQVSDQTML